MVAMRESAGEVVKLPVVRRRRSQPQKLSLDPLVDPRSLPRAPSQVAEVWFATATLKARGSPVQQITKGIDARADLQSVEPSPEWRSPPAQMETGKWRRPCADRGALAYPYRRRQSAVFQRGRAGQRRRWHLPGMQTRDLPLHKSLKTATVAPAPLASRCTSD